MAELRDVRQEAAVKAFLRLGGRERTGKGSHRVIRMPNGSNLSLPAGTLKVGLLKAAIRMSGFSEAEFKAVLR